MHRYGEESFLAIDSHAPWSCDLCTLINPGPRRTCAACRGPRPLRPGTWHLLTTPLFAPPPPRVKGG
jgi:hypothetical protein